MKTRILALSLSLTLLLVVIDLIRREKMTFRYALWWLILCLAALMAAGYERLLFKLARLAGFELPSNFIFFLIGVFFVLLSLALTVYICQQNSRLERLGQQVGILQEELSRLRRDDSART